MSSVTSGSRLPRSHPITRARNWCTYLLGGLALVAVAWLFALVMAVSS
jgi:hypothetical protein